MNEPKCTITGVVSKNDPTIMAWELMNEPRCTSDSGFTMLKSIRNAIAECLPDHNLAILVPVLERFVDLKAILDSGNNLPFPDGLLINGRASNAYTYTVEQGKTYRFRISNVGLTTSINFRIQGHKMTLVEVEGTHTLQNTYDSLDIHLGQSYSVLVITDQLAQDYYIVASTRFTSQVLTAASIFHYSNSADSAYQNLPRN